MMCLHVKMANENAKGTQKQQNMVRREDDELPQWQMVLSDTLCSPTLTHKPEHRAPKGTTCLEKLNVRQLKGA